MNGRIDILAKNLLIRASAGSGKTYQLGSRVVGLVGVRGVDPERIVALTFTRKAAGEFADAVLTKLAKAARDRGEEERLGGELGGAVAAGETLARVVRALPRLRLGTLDGFFARVVRAFQHELGLSGGRFELIEGPRLEAALADIRADLLGDRLDGAAGAGFLHAFKRATAGREEQRVAESLQQFIAEWHGVWKAAGDARALDAGGVFGELPAVAEWEARKGDLAARIRNGLAGTAWTDKRQPAALDKLVDVLAAHTVASGSLAGAPSLFGQLVDWLAAGGGPLELRHYKGFAPAAPAAAALAEALRLLAGCELAAAVGRTAAVGELVAGFDRECARRLRRRGLLGFDDVKVLMGEWTRCEEARLRREAVDFRLDGRFDHWLLDEFQDTSPAEWAGIVPLLDEAAMRADGTLFIVGDAKQAIYGWRGGDVRLFKQVRERYGGGGGLAEATMPQSRRSCPEVLALVNAVCGDGGVIGRLFGAAVAARWPWEEHSCAVERLHGEARVELLAGGREERLDRLVGLLEELGVRRRQLTCGVLVRTNDQVREIAERLRAEGFDAIEEGSRRPAADNPAGVAVFQLVRWLANPADRQAREVLEMSPLWAAIAGRWGGPWQAAWEGLLAEAHAGGFAALVEGLLGPLWAGLSEFGRRRAGDVIGALAQFDAAGGGSARAAVRWLDGLEVAQGPGSAAVQVMTIHKAKGLGFDVVVLPEVEDVQVPNAVRLRVLRGPGWWLQPPAGWVRKLVPELRAAEERWGGDQCYEALCLLYVALTRARRGLYVLLSVPPATRKDPDRFASPANWILQALGGTGKPGTVFQAGDRSWLDAMPERPATPPPAAPVLGTAVPLRRRGSPSGAEAAAGAAVAATREAAKGMAFGSEVHACFERVGWLDEGTGGLGEGAAAALVRDCLAVPAIGALFARRAGLAVHREVPLETILDGAWVSGVIDRLLVEHDPAGRPLAATVVDFKTDAVASAGELVERHRAQVAAYRRGVAGALGLPPGAVRGVLVSTALRDTVEA